MDEYVWDEDEWEQFIKAESKALDDFDKSRDAQWEALEE